MEPDLNKTFFDTQNQKDTVVNPILIQYGILIRLAISGI